MCSSVLREARRVIFPKLKINIVVPERVGSFIPQPQKILLSTIVTDDMIIKDEIIME